MHSFYGAFKENGDGTYKLCREWKTSLSNSKHTHCLMCNKKIVTNFSHSADQHFFLSRGYRGKYCRENCLTGFIILEGLSTVGDTYEYLLQLGINASGNLLCYQDIEYYNSDHGQNYLKFLKCISHDSISDIRIRNLCYSGIKTIRLSGSTTLTTLTTPTTTTATTTPTTTTATTTTNTSNGLFCSLTALKWLSGSK
jgi:hypothetical protein